MIFSEKNKRYKVNRQLKEDIEPHEIFLDKLARKKEEELGLSEQKLEVPLSEKITKFIFGIFLFIILALFAKTFHFQIIQGGNFSLLSEGNKTRILLIKPERGIIYDKNLKPLAENAPAFDLVCDKRDLFLSPFEGARKIKEIAGLIGKNPETLEKEIEESERSRVLVADNLSHETLVVLEAKINEFPGCEIEKNVIRNYFSGPLFFHLIGYTGKINKEELKIFKDYSVSDSIGKSGLERSYEDYLRGRPGKIQVEKDAFGNKKSEKLLELPEAGKNLILYLDSDLQTKIAEALEKSMKAVGGKRAAAVALDPRTGGVLALVSLPAIDNNLLNLPLTPEQWKELQTNELKPFLNRVVSGGYLTGSTIKPLIAAAALEENIISPDKNLYCPLELCLFNRYSGEKECYSDWKFHGWTDLRRAIAESVNPYFYMVGGGYIKPNFADGRLPQIFEGLGDSKIKKWLTLFNWGLKTGIDLPGEIEGRVPDSEWKKSYFQDTANQAWTIGDTYNLSIGQGYIRVSPLQVTTAFSAIANGGTLYQPEVVHYIINTSTSTNYATTYATTTEAISNKEEIKPKIIRENFADPQNLKIVREGMRQAVTDGSSRLLIDLPVKAAAKTGTAETPKKDYFHHWVTVFAPYEDPQIVLTVMIEEVEGLQSATLPVAQEVLNWYFSR